MFWIAQLLEFLEDVYGVPCGLYAEVMGVSSVCLRI